MDQDRKLPRERVLQMGEFIDRALRITRARMANLGLQEDAWLDPELSIDHQVAILRGLFLEAEKSALPFDSRDNTFWRIVRARLQPVVLAYLTHEKFIQSLDKEGRELRPDLLTEVYRDRLDNSDQFRNFFFALNEKLKQDSVEIEQRALQESGPSQHSVSVQYRTAEDTQAIQGNVLKMLEKQLRDLEKVYSKQGVSLTRAQEEILCLKDIIHEKNDEIAALEKKYNRLQEESFNLKISLDAADRDDKELVNADEEAALVDDELVDADREQLLLKVASLEHDLASTANAAYNTFMSSSDLGIVILFMLSSFRCKSPQQLAREMARSISTFGLKNVVGTDTGSGQYHFEASIGADINLAPWLEQHRGVSASVENRFLLCYQSHCCVLIQEPPRDDEDRYARLKDNLGTLLQGAEARWGAINSAQAVQRQSVQVEQLILRSHVVFETFEKNIARQNQRLLRFIDLLGQDVRRNLNIIAGDQKDTRLNKDLKKFEDSLRDLFRIQELIDPAFMKNISRVAQGIQTKNRKNDN